MGVVIRHTRPLSHPKPTATLQTPPRAAGRRASGDARRRATAGGAHGRLVVEARGRIVTEKRGAASSKKGSRVFFRSTKKRVSFQSASASRVCLSAPIMPPPLPTDRFLTELHKMFEGAKAGGSVSLTTKRSEWGWCGRRGGGRTPLTHTRTHLCCMRGVRESRAAAKHGQAPP